MKSRIDYSLYLVTDSGLMSTPTLEDAVEKAARGGCTLVQLREKDMCTNDMISLGKRIKAVTDKFGIPLIINDDVAAAAAIGAAGVHIGQSDMSAAEVRKILGADYIIGVSAGSVQEAVKAQQSGADYLGIGAMFSTGTKTDANIVSKEELFRITQAVSIPTVIIGGINEKTIPLFGDAEIDGVSVVSAVIAQQDIEEAARRVKRLFLSGRRPAVRGYKAAIFDLDGTLFDSLDVWENIDKRFLSRRGFDVPDFYVSETAARSLPEAAAYTIDLFGLDEKPEALVQEWNELALYEYTHNIRLKPDVREYLEELTQKGIKMCVATSLPERLFAPLLKANDIEHFFDFACSVDEVPRGKQYPDIYEHVIKKLGVPPADCIVFEDVLPAIKSAKTAGASVCAIYDRYSGHVAREVEEAADWYIDSFLKAPIFK